VIPGANTSCKNSLGTPLPPEAVRFKILCPHHSERNTVIGLTRATRRTLRSHVTEAPSGFGDRGVTGRRAA